MVYSSVASSAESNETKVSLATAKHLFLLLLQKIKQRILLKIFMRAKILQSGRNHSHKQNLHFLVLKGPVFFLLFVYDVQRSSKLRIDLTTFLHVLLPYFRNGMRLISFLSQIAAFMGEPETAVLQLKMKYSLSLTKTKNSFKFRFQRRKKNLKD